MGLTGFSDLRDIQDKAAQGDADCQLALQMMAYRIKKFIDSYITVLNGIDAILFTAGIGENSSLLREMVCENMDVLGIQIDAEKNQKPSVGISEIQDKGPPVKILVFPTNEELEIAKQSYGLMTS